MCHIRQATIGSVEAHGCCGAGCQTRTRCVNCLQRSIAGRASGLLGGFKAYLSTPSTSMHWVCWPVCASCCLWEPVAALCLSAAAWPRRHIMCALCMLQLWSMPVGQLCQGPLLTLNYPTRFGNHVLCGMRPVSDQIVVISALSVCNAGAHNGFSCFLLSPLWLFQRQCTWLKQSDSQQSNQLTVSITGSALARVPTGNTVR